MSSNTSRWLPEIASLSVLIIGIAVIIYHTEKTQRLADTLREETMTLNAKVLDLEKRLEIISKPKTIPPMDLSEFSKKWIEGYKAACKRAKDILVNQTDKLYEREGRQVLDDAWSQIDKLEKTAFQDMPTVISNEEVSGHGEGANPDLRIAPLHTDSPNSDKPPQND